MPDGVTDHLIPEVGVPHLIPSTRTREPGAMRRNVWIAYARWSPVMTMAVVDRACHATTTPSRRGSGAPSTADATGTATMADATTATRTMRVFTGNTFQAGT